MGLALPARSTFQDVQHLYTSGDCAGQDCNTKDATLLFRLIIQFKGEIPRDRQSFSRIQNCIPKSDYDAISSQDTTHAAFMLPSCRTNTSNLQSVATGEDDYLDVRGGGEIAQTWQIWYWG